MQSILATAPPLHSTPTPRRMINIPHVARGGCCSAYKAYATSLLQLTAHQTQLTRQQHSLRASMSGHSCGDIQRMAPAAVQLSPCHKLENPQLHHWRTTHAPMWQGLMLHRTCARRHLMTLALRSRWRGAHSALLLGSSLQLAGALSIVVTHYQMQWERGVLMRCACSQRPHLRRDGSKCAMRRSLRVGAPKLICTL
jgi:hypothetical protein